MKTKGYIFLALSLIVIASIGCNQKSQYERKVEAELKKDVRNDSLFLGYYLGMARDEFYNYSWELNKKRIIKEGTGNQSVEYKIKEELPYKATMNFYPEFRDKKVSKMRVKFSYDAWAPWNKNLSADSLIIDVKELMKEWYGNGFFKVNSPVFGPTFVKIDGNREMAIYKTNDNVFVNVIFSDLTAEGKNPALLQEKK